MNFPQNIASYLSEYGPIALGLLVGTVAHFGRKMVLGEYPTRRQVLGFLMQLGMVGLIASVATKGLNITDNDARALATAILAISANEVLEYFKRNGWSVLAGAVAPERRDD